ncbi:unnamed protein product [Camellia sinensis]
MQVKLYGFDNEPQSPGGAPQGEDNKEIDRLFKSDKKKKKGVRSVAEIGLLVENVMAELEVVAEEDAELNRQSKPATTKLKKPPLLMEVLSKKQLHHGHYDRREQLKKSGLGKVIMFLLKSDEETTTNRRMAKALVDKWGIEVWPVIFHASYFKGRSNDNGFSGSPQSKIDPDEVRARVKQVVQDQHRLKVDHPLLGT